MSEDAPVGLIPIDPGRRILFDVTVEIPKGTKNKAAAAVRAIQIAGTLAQVDADGQDSPVAGVTGYGVSEETEEA